MVAEGTEAELVGRCQAGADPDAFRALFELHKDRIYSIALRYSGDASVAQDIAQETFLKLLASVESFRGEADFGAWLYRLVVNACFDRKRRTRRFLPMWEGLLGVLRAPGKSALERVLEDEKSRLIQKAIEGLPSGQRMVVVLRYTEGLSYEQIGAILECPAGTVASRINRVHKVLEGRLAKLKIGTECRGEK